MPTFKRIMQWVLGLSFIFAGINHFRSLDFYLSMMPPYLPWHEALVDISGVIEILLGILLLVPKCTTLAAWGLIALLIAVFPANLQMALHPADFPKFDPLLLWLRLPLQGVLIAWAYWYTRPVVRT